MCNILVSDQGMQGVAVPMKGTGTSCLGILEENTLLIVQKPSVIMPQYGPKAAWPGVCSIQQCLTQTSEVFVNKCGDVSDHSHMLQHQAESKQPPSSYQPSTRRSNFTPAAWVAGHLPNRLFTHPAECCSVEIPGPGQFATCNAIIAL